MARRERFEPPTYQFCGKALLETSRRIIAQFVGFLRIPQALTLLGCAILMHYWRQIRVFGQK
jgi:hypothetical protein